MLMKTHIAKRAGALVALLTIGSVARELRAADQEPVTMQVEDADLKELNDPTILSRRVSFEHEWNHFEDGSDIIEDTLSSQWAWRLTSNTDWAVRLKVPGKYRFGSDDPNVPDIGGVGGAKLAGGAAARARTNFRIGGGLDLEFPTGRSELSDNAYRIQEFVAFGWDITPHITFSPSFEYNQSLSTEYNGNINFLEVFAPFTFTLPHKWAVGFGY